MPFPPSSRALLLLALAACAAGSPDAAGSDPGTIAHTSVETRRAPLDQIFGQCKTPTPAQLRAVQLDLYQSSENLRKFKASERLLKLYWQHLVAYYDTRRSTCESYDIEQGPEKPAWQNISAEGTAGCPAYDSAINAYNTLIHYTETKIAGLRDAAKVAKGQLQFELNKLAGIQPTPEEAKAHPDAFAQVPADLTKLENWVHRVTEQGRVDAAPYEEERRGHREELYTLERRSADCQKPKSFVPKFR